MFCQYKNLFGEPKKGAHSYRLFDIAIVDVILTIIGAFLLHKYYFIKKNIKFWKVLIGLFVFGIILHRLFCVRTTIDKFLFPNF